jgi:segregation and condensation protein B
MSLKAKLEAVIYAAEEPVTLGQLAVLFAADALDWKSEREAAAAAAVAEQSASVSESLPANGEFNYAALEVGAEATVEACEDVSPAADAEIVGEAVGSEAVADGGDETVVDAAHEAVAEPVAAADAEAEEKRLARQRDREVRAILRGLLDELIATYASDDRGIEIKEIAGGFRMATKPECHDAARMFVKGLKPVMKLSLPALETLAVIAYKQPVTAPEVNEIRGVDSSAVFGSLLARKLIATAGRKQVIGRPILYKTTKEFLLRFGLKDVSELPSMEEFEKMAQLEFEDMETSAEAESTPVSDDDLSLELEESGDDPIDDPAEIAAGQTQESVQQEVLETAARADSNPSPAAKEPEPREPNADLPAAGAATTPAEGAPAAPSPLAEQAETETVPYD